jgi:hypothetical protein
MIRSPLAIGLLAVPAFVPPSLSAQGPMDDLARPQEGRSMRATSSFRGKVGGKTRIVNGRTRLAYDPDADYLSDPTTENSNSDNFTVEPGGKHVLLEAEGPGVITHMWITFLWPEPGTYTVKLQCVGKAFRSEGYGLGLESVRLRERRPRVASYGLDRDKDWRKNPTVFEDD